MGIGLIHPIIALGGLIVFLFIAHLVVRPVRPYEWHRDEIQLPED